MSEEAKLKAKAALEKAKQLLKAKKAAAQQAQIAQQEKSSEDVEVIGEKLAPKTFDFVFQGSFLVTFQIPVTVKRALVLRPYLVLVFNYGSVCISDETGQNRNFRPGCIVKGQFIHTDSTRMSYNLVHLVDLNQTFEKPKFATAALQYMIKKRPFFIQETALTRIYQFFLREFQGVELFTNCTLQTALHPTQLSKDGMMLMNKCQQKAQTSSDNHVSAIQNIVDDSEQDSEIQIVETVSHANNGDLEIVPFKSQTPTEEYAQIALPGALPSEKKIVFDNSYYSPLTTEMVAAVMNCDICGLNFCTAAERMIHYLNTPECKTVLIDSTAEFSGSYHDLIDISCQNKLAHSLQNLTFPLTCQTCGESVSSIFRYCIHKETHRYKATVFTCMFCSQVLGSPTQFVRHHCYLNFLAEKENLYNPSSNMIQNPNTFYKSVEESEQACILSCLYCQKAHKYISGLVVHLVSDVRCYKKLVKDTQPHGKLVLSDIILKDRVKPVQTICHVCGWAFSNQVTYMLHMEHHKFENDQLVECKICKRTYATPCTFHRHGCTQESLIVKPVCLICKKLENIQNIARLKQQISLASTVKMPEDTIQETPVDPNLQQMPIDSPSANDIVISEVSSCTSIVEENKDEDLSDSIQINDDLVQNIKKERPEPKIQIKTEIEEFPPSSYCSARSREELVPENSENWYFCLDCHSNNLLKDSDDLERHSEEFQEHFYINAASNYNRLTVRLEDIKNHPSYQHLMKDE